MVKTFQHDEPIEQFYSLLAELSRVIDGPRRVSELRRDPFFPTRGVYFFYEEGEMRPGSQTSRRVVRVGTHGLKANATSTLYGRLCQHRGSKGGGGNHRGSVFRRHVGIALINELNVNCPTWTKNKVSAKQRFAERSLEQMVSRYIGAMEVVWLAVLDQPGPRSLRGYIERNAIGLLSGREPASPTWLGYYTNNESFARSYLWNVDHIDYRPDPKFLEVFRGQLREMPPPPPRSRRQKQDARHGAGHKKLLSRRCRGGVAPH